VKQQISTFNCAVNTRSHKTKAQSLNGKYKVQKADNTCRNFVQYIQETCAVTLQDKNKSIKLNNHTKKTGKTNTKLGCV
jgi:tRNA A37 methylthiotransferase MiaB